VGWNVAWTGEGTELDGKTPMYAMGHADAEVAITSHWFYICKQWRHKHKGRGTMEKCIKEVRSKQHRKEGRSLKNVVFKTW